MEPMTLHTITEAMGVPYHGPDAEVTAICTDTRTLSPGCLFVALKGERFDGHRFVRQALEDGAAWAVVMEDGDYPQDRVFRVADTRQALLNIAGRYRRERDVKVVAVTGSVGKTTTKEMVACVVSAGYNTLKTELNLNNEIGLSQTILGLAKEHGAAVLEMGMDGPGQIAPLSRSAAPDVGVLTNIGISHMETLGSRQNILKEKLDIRAGMSDGATLVLSADDDLLAKVTDPRLNLVFYGIDNPKAEVRAEKIKSFSTHTTFEILYNGNRFDAQIPTMGRHNVQNALAAFAVGNALGVDPIQSILALRHYRPAGMRQNVVSHAGFTVVEDCYNAAPDSMRAALEAFGDIQTAGRKILVLADMLELGELEQKAHYEAGLLAAKSGVELLLCTGPLAKGYVEGARAAGMTAEAARHFADQESLFAVLREMLRQEDVVWVKGSRGMHLERLVETIYKEC